METRRVTLELLRKGPAHNQLLSPLTEYLCLCGNFGATIVTVPWEHEQFLRKVRELCYHDYGTTHSGDDENVRRRQETIGELAKEMGGLLGAVPGLAHGINGASMNGQATLTHVRMVISAAELAMLPFELSKNIAGIPGGKENWLSLHTSHPVCITRHVRSVTHRHVKWPNKPKILFIAASPAGKIPLKSHLHALVAAVKPWVKSFDYKNPDDILKKTSEILTIIPAADIEMITSACEKENYTHIHILAHGAEDKKTPGSPFGIALHDSRDPSKADVVTGTRLAAAVCPLKRGHPGPAVITLASCDSGAISSVIHSTGASFAHDLHKEGIPLIIASQSPLTFYGSIMLVEEIYGNLLWGADPIKTILNLRTKLYALRSTDNHDWASLVIYECLQDTLKDYLAYTAYNCVKAAIDNILWQADEIISNGHVPTEESIEGLLNHIKTIAKRYPDNETYKVEILGLLGTLEKRKAELYYRVALNTSDMKESKRWLIKSYETLLATRRLYFDAMSKSLMTRTNFRSSSHWLITQYLSLSMVLCCNDDDIGYWQTAMKAAETDIRYVTDERIWAHSSLAELYLIRLAYSECLRTEDITREKAAAMALEHIRKVRELSKADAFQIQSTRRQLKRYLEWWCKDDFQETFKKKSCDKAIVTFSNLIKCAAEMIKILDDSVKGD